jgi:hypothetical protein
MSRLKTALLGAATSLALISGCSADGDTGHKTSDPPSGFLSTGAKIPNPCSLVGADVSNDLVGLKEGRQTNGPEPHDSSSVVECEWSNDGLSDDQRKQGIIKVGAHVDLLRSVTGDPYLGAKVYFRSLTSSKKCKTTPVAATEICWYGEPGTSLAVVLRKDSSTAWFTCEAKNSPSLSGERLPGAARHVAQELLSNLS